MSAIKDIVKLKNEIGYNALTRELGLKSSSTLYRWITENKVPPSSKYKHYKKIEELKKRYSND